eukprot:CAMPEP_0179456136 /NCGR_PEP_ID=MMETSP0799-20121207/39927_1 /TAXON_ID=46947 /ORGANISM="Geminigera cryophila, Strain CCMP2564" /LENGTH=231 /DNA_ID=CAMNT_0021255567 /DNA_START=8 /DNA_END=699 /DNA_ORIENTATION=+
MTGRRLLMLLAACGIAGALELKCGADHNCDMLPDMADPANSKHLKCGACQLAAVQLAHAVIKKEAALRRKLSEEAATTLFEEFCEQDITEYGLQLDSNGAPMPKFTNDVTLNRASGGWVKRTLMGVCNDLISDYEEELRSVTKKYCSTQTNSDGAAVLSCDPAPLAPLLCQRELKMCSAEDFASELDAEEPDPSSVDSPPIDPPSSDASLLDSLLDSPPSAPSKGFAGEGG